MHRVIIGAVVAALALAVYLFWSGYMDNVGIPSAPGPAGAAAESDK